MQIRATGEELVNLKIQIHSQAPTTLQSSFHFTKVRIYLGPKYNTQVILYIRHVSAGLNRKQIIFLSQQLVSCEKHDK